MAEWTGIFEDSWGDITKVSPNDNRYLWIPSPTGSPIPLMPLTDIALNKFLKPDESYVNKGKFGCDDWEVTINYSEAGEIVIDVKISGPDGYSNEYSLNDGNDIFADDPIIYDHTESDLPIIAPFIGAVPGFYKHTTGGNHSDNPHLANGDEDIVLKTESGKTWIIRETEIGEEGDDIESKFKLDKRAYASGRPFYYRTGTIDRAMKYAEEAVNSGECEADDQIAIWAYVNSKTECKGK